MLTLTIKKKWFDMICSGEKKEEYREISQYYYLRFGRYLGWQAIKGEWRKEEFLCRLRNGYDITSPSVVVRCTVSIGTGKPEWGAEAGKEYYVLKILSFETER